MALLIEIAKIQPPGRGGVFELRQIEKFNQLSESNRLRLEAAVTDTFLPKLSDDSSKQIRRYVDNIEFAFLSENVSPNSDDFFFKLLGGTRLTEFKIFAIPRGGPLTSFHNRIYSDRVRLEPSFAHHGFVMPRFSGARNLINFFLSWNPNSVEELQRQQRYGLPRTVQSLEDFVVHLMASPLTNFFPDDKLRDRLAPLREPLSSFTLSLADAEIFFKSVLTHYLLHKMDIDSWDLARVDSAFREPGGVDDLFQGALNWIQWDGASLHVPLKIPFSELRRVYVVETEFLALPEK